MSLRGWVIACVSCFVVMNVAAQNNTTQQQTTSSDTQYIPLDYIALMREFERASRPTFWQRMGDVISGKSKNDENSNFKFGGNVGVGYTQETEAMFMATGVAQYALKDELPQSFTSLTGMLSLNGSYRLRAIGDLWFSEKERLEYNFGGGVMPVRFWGLGYDMADVNTRSKYTCGNFDAEFLYLRNIVAGLTLGVGVDLQYTDAYNFEPLAEGYLQSAGVNERSAFISGATLVAQYDGRRYSKSGSVRGYFLKAQGEFYPSFMSNQGVNLWNVEATMDYYQPLWYGAVVAVDLYADMWAKNTPWLFWPKIGGDSRMRGYYYGRYIDRNMITAQMELRQTVYGPFGCVVWGGVGSLFSSYSKFDFNKLLPNYGIGVRVAANGRTSFRVDYGFGRNSNGLVINVNEAF